MTERWETGWVCPHCNKPRGDDGVDPCLGLLPGVAFACCGHGGHDGARGYIAFTNGVVIRFDKLREVENLDRPIDPDPEVEGTKPYPVRRKIA